MTGQERAQLAAQMPPAGLKLGIDSRAVNGRTAMKGSQWQIIVVKPRYGLIDRKNRH